MKYGKASESSSSTKASYLTATHGFSNDSCRFEGEGSARFELLGVRNARPMESDAGSAGSNKFL